jgi:hypothetical protein
VSEQLGNEQDLGGTCHGQAWLPGINVARLNA